MLACRRGQNVLRGTATVGKRVARVGARSSLGDRGAGARAAHQLPGTITLAHISKNRLGGQQRHLSTLTSLEEEGRGGGAGGRHGATLHIGRPRCTVWPTSPDLPPPAPPSFSRVRDISLSCGDFVYTPHVTPVGGLHSRQCSWVTSSNLKALWWRT